jgi:hypothetical protein
VSNRVLEGYRNQTRPVVFNGTNQAAKLLAEHRHEVAAIAGDFRLPPGQKRVGVKAVGDAARSELARLKAEHLGAASQAREMLRRERRRQPEGTIGEQIAAGQLRDLIASAARSDRPAWATLQPVIQRAFLDGDTAFTQACRRLLPGQLEMIGQPLADVDIEFLDRVGGDDDNRQAAELGRELDKAIGHLTGAYAAAEAELAEFGSIVAPVLQTPEGGTIPVDGPYAGSSEMQRELAAMNRTGGPVRPNVEQA